MKIIKDINDEYLNYDYILCCDKNNKVLALFSRDIDLDEYDWGYAQYCIFSKKNKFQEKYYQLWELIWKHEEDNYMWYSIDEQELIDNNILIPEKWNFDNIDKLKCWYKCT